MLQAPSFAMGTSQVFFPTLYPHYAKMIPKTVLVIGANGYIGNAVACAFVKAQYTTLGVIRSAKNAPSLAKQGVRPIIGSASDSQAMIEAVSATTKTLDVIVSTTEQWPDYQSHFEETVALISALAQMSNSAGVKPLVIFSSGCKDYGTGSLDKAVNCKPYTETTVLNPPSLLAPRTNNAPRIFEHSKDFDAVLTRPTNVHGRSSSFYGLFIELGQRAKKHRSKLVFPGDPRTIAHSIHVDDCGEAYVALAEHTNRSEVAGQVFNISAGQKYETMGQIADAITKVFELEHKVECIAPPPSEVSMTSALFAWSQWVGSEKIRKLTGWKDTRPMFAEGLSLYKQEYEEAVRTNDENVTRMLARYGNTVGQMEPGK